MSLINLDALEIKNEASIIGSDPANPTDPGAAGRVAFAKDTNILYFAEDPSTWIKFLPQDAAIASSTSGPLSSTVGGVAASVTGTGFLNGYYSMDAERAEIGIYFSGTSNDPLPPKVFVYETEEKYESILLENVLAPVESAKIEGSTVNYPMVHWDMERWAVSENQEQTISINSVTAGDLVRVLVNGNQESITTAGANDSAIAAQVSILLAASYPAGTWSSSGSVVTVSAPVGEITLSPDPLYLSGSDGSGTAIITETVKGYAALKTTDSHGSLRPYKKFKDAANIDHYFGTRPTEHSNYYMDPKLRFDNWDLDSGEYNGDEGYYYKNEKTDNYATNMSYGGHLSKALAEQGQTGYMPRLHKIKINRAGEVYYHTGLQSMWTGMDNWGSYAPYQDQDHTLAINDSRYHGVHGALRNVSQKWNYASTPNLRGIPKSNLYYTHEVEEPQKGIDIAAGEVYYSHWVGNLPQPHEVHGKRSKSYLGHHHSAYSRQVSVASSYYNTHGGNLFNLHFGLLGIWMDNYGLDSSSDKNKDAYYFSPAGNFLSYGVTGYENIYETHGHSSDSLWGGIPNDPFSEYWDDSTYTPAQTGVGLSGIGRRHTFLDKRNTFAKDEAGYEDHAFYNSNNRTDPEDKSDNAYPVEFLCTPVTGFQPYEAGTTLANMQMRTFDEAYDHAGQRRSNDPEAYGKHWGNPNNHWRKCYSAHQDSFRQAHISAYPGNAHQRNYINKSTRWPYNMLTCYDGGAVVPWKDTIAAVKDGRLSWGPTDDFSFEVIYKSTPPNTGGTSNLAKKQNSSNSSNGFYDGVIGWVGAENADSPYSMPNMVANKTNISNSYKEHQGSLLALGSFYDWRWLQVSVTGGRLCVTNYRAHRQGRAGEYPAQAPWLAGETLLDNDKWYHFTVVKNSAENKLELYVNGVLDARATLVADVSAHGSAYNGGTYYTDVSVTPNIQNLPVDNKTVPAYVSSPEKGYGNYSWMGEYWGYPVAGNAKYQPDGNGGIGNGTEVPYSMGFLNVDKVAIDSTSYRTQSTVANGGVPDEEGRFCKTNYHGELRQSADINGFGKMSIEDMNDWENTAGYYSFYSAMTIGHAWGDWTIYGRFGTLHLANKVLFDADFSNNFTVDPWYGIIDSNYTPQKISESELFLNWDNAPAESFDYEDMAYFDFKIRSGSKSQFSSSLAYGTQSSVPGHTASMVDVYGRVGDTIFEVTMPTNWYQRVSLNYWATNAWHDKYISATIQGDPNPCNIYRWVGYLNPEGENGQNNIDSTRDSVRTSLINKYFNL